MVKKKITTTVITEEIIEDTRPKTFHDFILIDRSGSMASRLVETTSAVNAYIKELKAKENPIKITVATFDDYSGLKLEIIRDKIPLTEVKEILQVEIHPRGGTPLYDAIGKLSTKILEDNPDNSAFIIITDGEENASREMKKESTKKILDSFREKGWQTIFLGVDFENFSQARDLGNSYGSTISVNAVNFGQTMSATASMRSTYATTGQNMVYTEKDRAAAKK